jgi:hypothetical protein
MEQAALSMTTRASDKVVLTESIPEDIDRGARPVVCSRFAASFSARADPTPWLG